MSDMDPVYLDYNATTPIAPEVAEAMAPLLRGGFGNPSSAHGFGTEAKKIVERARAEVAALLGCSPAEVVFTSGGTESNNHAIKGAAFAARERGHHIITSAVEHPAVSEVCRWLETQGFKVTVLPVDAFGLVNPADLERAITPDTILVTVMHANNEVGTIQPIRELAEIAHRHGALMHTDAAQSVGKIPVRMDELGVDLLSVAGHKLYAPKGVGALVIRDHVRLAPLLHGADHESGRRPGTENVLLVAGLGRACRLAGEKLAATAPRMRALRDRLHEGLGARFGDTVMRLNGHPELRLPNTLSVSFRGVEANTLLSEIVDEVAASAGAACHADGVDISAVLEAMKVPVDWAMGTVRFSVGRATTEAEIDRAVEAVSAAVSRLQPEGDRGTPLIQTDDGDEVKLTRFTHGMGCACKLRPQALEQVLAKLTRPTDAALLVGADTSDDAAVYRLTDDLALVQTVDFFTPIVDDPYWFGAISAANSLSDIYAMGAKPLLALNVVGFPSNRLPLRVLERILQGAQDKADEAGIVIAGGHTVDDPEPKFGLAVSGVVHPDRIVRNNTARPGDALVLTKRLGTGIVATAVKRGLAEPDEAREATELMATLNRAAGEAMIAVGAHACTDITGFGFLGHLVEMARGSAVDVEIQSAEVPLLASALRHAGADVVPGGTLDNLSHVGPRVTFDPGVSRVTRLVLADAQTSGGLLISLPEERAEALLARLRESGVTDAARVGRVTGPGDGHITIR
jgi:cysteine desulfurase